MDIEDLRQILGSLDAQLNAVRSRSPIHEAAVDTALSRMEELDAKLQQAEEEAAREQAANAAAKQALGRQMIATAGKIAQQADKAAREKALAESQRQAVLDRLATSLGMNPNAANYALGQLGEKLRQVQSQQQMLMESIASNKRVGLIDGIGNWLDAQFQMQDDFANLKDAVETEAAITSHLNTLNTIFHNALVNLGSLLPQQTQAGVEAELEAKRLKNELDILEAKERITGISTAKERAYKVLASKYNQAERQFARAIQFVERNSAQETRLLQAKARMLEELQRAQINLEATANQRAVIERAAKILGVSPEEVTLDMAKKAIFLRARDVRPPQDMLEQLNTQSVYEHLGMPGEGVDVRELKKVAPSIPAYGSLGSTIGDAVDTLHKLKSKGYLAEMTPQVRSFIRAFDESAKQYAPKDPLRKDDKELMQIGREKFSEAFHNEAQVRNRISIPLLQALATLPTLADFEAALDNQAKSKDVQMRFAIAPYKRVSKDFLSAYKDAIGKGDVKDSLEGLLSFAKQRARTVDFYTVANDAANLARALNIGRAGYSISKVMGLDGDLNKHVIIELPNGKKLDLLDADAISRFLLDQGSFMEFYIRTRPLAVFGYGE